LSQIKTRTRAPIDAVIEQELWALFLSETRTSIYWFFPANIVIGTKADIIVTTKEAKTVAKKRKKETVVCIVYFLWRSPWRTLKLSKLPDPRVETFGEC
jgi:hypothetical protein